MLPCFQSRLGGIAGPARGLRSALPVRRVVAPSLLSGQRIRNLVVVREVNMFEVVLFAQCAIEVVGPAIKFCRRWVAQAAATELVEAKLKDSDNEKTPSDDSTVVSPTELNNGTVVYDSRAASALQTSEHAITENGNGSNGKAVQERSVPESNGSSAASSTLPSPPPILPSKPAVASSNSSSQISPLSTASLDAAMDPSAAGQIETVAATAAAAPAPTASTAAPSAGPPVSSSPAEIKKPTTAAGTPYSNPGGRWSQFKTYSTFQVDLS